MTTSNPNPNDPSGFITNPPSTIVKIQNTSQDTMNGLLGVVVQYNPDRQRYLVHLTKSQQTVALKSDNLTKASMMENMTGQYEALRNNPQIQREISKYYEIVNAKLQPYGVKPEQAAIGVGVTLLVVMYFVGFTKVLMTLSLIMLLGIIMAPDIQTMVSAGNFNWKLLVSNFPSRCKYQIEEMIPMARGKVSNRMAAGLVLGIVAISLRMIVMPSSTGGGANPPPTIPPRPLVPSATTAGGATIGGGLTIDQAYKLGFDDSTEGNEFGTSLPPRDVSEGATTAASRTAGSAAGASSYNDFPDLQYSAQDYRMMTAPPSQPWYKKLGIWQGMAMMNVARTVWEFGKTIEGGWDLQLAIANVQMAQPMKLGLLAFSIYNVVKVFL